MSESAEIDALVQEVIDIVLAYQGQGVGGPHASVREAIESVYPPGGHDGS